MLEMVGAGPNKQKPAPSGPVFRRTGLVLLNCLHQLGDHVLGVAEEHAGVVPVEELVLDPREALPPAALDDEDVLRLINVEDRHPIKGTALAAGGRVDHVVGADHQGDVGALELGVDVVEVVELVVGDAGLDCGKLLKPRSIEGAGAEA